MATEVRTTCPYCGVGCGVVARRRPDGTVAIAGDPEHPANFGRLCSKGSALAETLDLDDRLLHPELDGRRVEWETALDAVAGRFAATIAEHGPDSVAFYVSGQLLTEDYYVANKLMKGFIGSANIDTNSRLCMASSVAGHRRAFGSDTVPGTYEDLELADLVVLVGSNLAWCHPVLYQRLAAAKERRPGMRVVLIDPRRTMTADIADLHLPIRPDGDVALFNGLLAWLARTGRTDAAYIAAHTSGFDTALAAAQILATADLAAETGLDDASVARFYRLFGETERVVTVYSQGVNQSSQGTDKVNAILNCHLATGRIGRPGMGPFSVTGQPNAMGGREVGGLATMLAAHMTIEDPEHRDRVRRFWRAPSIAARPGLKAVEMFQAVADGRIKALWILATNPVVSMPDADAVRRALAACPVVVVSDVLRSTDTAALAHVRLPATAWGEKDGTVTNSERRISRQRRFLDPPGEARPDWWALAEVARRMGFGDAFPYTAPAEIFAEHAALSAFENNGSRDFDIGRHAGLDAAGYDRMAPFQWTPPEGTARFFAAGGFYTPDRRARFVIVDGRAARRTGAAFPLVLNTGRVRDHWHTLTRTGKSPRLSGHIAEPFAELHPDDATRLGVAEATLVRVRSTHGEVVVRAAITPRQAPGAVFVPMHWTDQFAVAARIDALVPSLTDPTSGQPALKHVPVRVERFSVATYGFAVTRRRPRAIAADYWAVARCAGGWRIELGLARTPDDWAAFAADLFDPPAGADLLAYRDAGAGQKRFAAFDADGLLGALYLAPEPVAVSRAWAAERLAARPTGAADRLAVLAGRPGAGQPDKGPVVCVCFAVGAHQIAAAVATGCGTVAAVGAALQAGTNCGSCRSEIRGIIDGYRRQAAE